MTTVLWEGDSGFNQCYTTTKTVDGHRWKPERDKVYKLRFKKFKTTCTVQDVHPDCTFDYVSDLMRETRNDGAPMIRELRRLMVNMAYVPALTLGGKPLTIVTQAKLLGLHIRSDLRWDDQVAEMVSKGSKRLNQEKLTALAREKDCGIISGWIQVTNNHIHWAATSTGDGHGDLLAAKWSSIENHLHTCMMDTMSFSHSMTTVLWEGGSGFNQVSLLSQAHSSNPKERCWIKADAGDVKQGLRESMTHEWSGDTDLRDRKLQQVQE
ncbi:Hypp2828 [Branchiostoma lanceolatum]|uniref:Hypp2828 protein n=1 Tax=Branchiostoma lanceolatum TaxID=7740 RepID=A0A8J9ZXJ4_BRALA|nr:Hypp2828 [Branchiostoma lanceolatum]